ncbi:MAG: thrombospondin type 3 repeat-containing protein [Lachnospiraceae bacterium]|nr:thrombospondin type 3 repeat-containing protein [Lachnospiraceae bacterium]
MTTQKPKKNIYLVIIVMIIVGIVIGRKIHAYKELKNAEIEFESVSNNADTIDERLLEKTIDIDYSSIKSDIEGWSVQDKVDAGLNAGDGSDTDMDGLSDKDEIEIYGTDPLKASTSGDMYTDGYKVSNGLEITKKYSNENIEFQNNYYPNEVILTAEHAEDLTTLVSKPVDSFMEEAEVFYGANNEVLDAYAFVKPCGTIAINVENTCKDLKKKEIAVIKIAYDFSYSEAVDFTLEDNVLTLMETFNHNNNDIFAIVIIKVDKENILHDVFFSNDYDDAEEADDLDAEDAGDSVEECLEKAHAIVTCTSPTYTFFVGTKPKIYYVSTGNGEADEKLIEKMYDFALDYVTCINEYEEALFPWEKKAFRKTEAQEITEIEYQSKLAFYKKLPINARREVWYDNFDTSFYVSAQGLFFSYFTYNDAKEEYAKKSRSMYSYDELKRLKNTSKSTNKEPFDIIYDTLPFKNFGSDYTDGNCAAFSILTAKHYNREPIVASGQYFVYNKKNGGKDSGEVVSYDLTPYKDMDVLTNYKSKEKLNSYMDRLYYNSINKKTLAKNNDSLTPKDEEFVKFMACLWRASNDMMFDNSNFHTMHKSEFGKINEVLSYKTSENIVAELDKGNVVICNFTTFKVNDSEKTDYGSYIVTKSDIADKSRYGAHSVVIYGYSYPMGDDVKELIDFYVYDSNFANGEVVVDKKRMPINTVIHGVYGKQYNDAYEPGFTMIYKPYYKINGEKIISNSVMASRCGNENSTYYIAFMTSDGRVLNEYTYADETIYNQTFSYDSIARYQHFSE